jgi:hypothetical protein
LCGSPREILAVTFQGIRNGFGNGREIADKTTIKVAETDEYLRLFLRLGSFPILDDLALAGRHSDAGAADDIPQKFDLLFLEFTLSNFRRQAIVDQRLQYTANKFSMLLDGAFAVDEDIVKIADYAVAEEEAHDIIHHSLKCGRRVAEAKRPNEIFVVAEGTAECGFPLIALAYADEVVTSLQIQFGEPIGPGDLFGELIHNWQQCAVLDCYVVEVAVIDAEE